MNLTSSGEEAKTLKDPSERVGPKESSDVISEDLARTAKMEPDGNDWEPTCANLQHGKTLAWLLGVAFIELEVASTSRKLCPKLSIRFETKSSRHVALHQTVPPFGAGKCLEDMVDQRFQKPRCHKPPVQAVHTLNAKDVQLDCLIRSDHFLSDIRVWARSDGAASGSIFSGSTQPRTLQAS